MTGLYTLFTDETNVTPKDGKFLIYGGLALSEQGFVAAHELVAEVRTKYGFKPEDQLKFQTASRPRGMDYALWTDAKTELVSRAAELDGVDLITYVILHAIAGGASDKERVEYALNALIAHFDLKYLAEKSAHGVVVVDRLDSKFGFNLLRSRFDTPISLPDRRTVDLKRILLLSQTSDGASHISSLVDVILGGFRYCVNAASGNGKDDVASKLFPPIAELMWGKTEGNVKRIGDWGFLRYPKSVRVAAYSREYDALAATLQRYGTTADETTDEEDNDA